MSYKVNKDEVQDCCECGEELDPGDDMCLECWVESDERLRCLSEFEDVRLRCLSEFEDDEC